MFSELAPQMARLQDFQKSSCIQKEQNLNFRKLFGIAIEVVARALSLNIDSPFSRTKKHRLSPLISGDGRPHRSGHAASKRAPRMYLPSADPSISRID